MLLLLWASGAARAATIEQVLAAVDAALDSGTRVPSELTSYCGEAGNKLQVFFPENRDFLCKASTRVDGWMLQGERPGDHATLEVRRFASREAATAVRTTAVKRFGPEPAGAKSGGLSWCNADVAWSGDWLWTLTSACGVPATFPKLAGVWHALLSAGSPATSGAVGIHGVEGGGTWLVDARGTMVTVPAR
jgi:hypothetical protein